jgi:hypothetical protein
MKTKRIILCALLVFGFVGWAWAHEGVEGDDDESSLEEMNKEDEAQARKQAFEVASQYAHSISCQTITEEKFLVTLVPWNHPDVPPDRMEAKYALI